MSRKNKGGMTLPIIILGNLIMEVKLILLIQTVVILFIMNY